MIRLMLSFTFIIFFVNCQSHEEKCTNVIDDISQKTTRINFDVEWIKKNLVHDKKSTTDSRLWIKRLIRKINERKEFIKENYAISTITECILKVARDILDGEPEDEFTETYKLIDTVFHDCLSNDMVKVITPSYYWSTTVICTVIFLCCYYVKLAHLAGVGVESVNIVVPINSDSPVI